MKRLLCFSEQKFRSLRPEQQHKKCAELLKELFSRPEELLKGHYDEICSWLTLHPIVLTRTATEERFHWHMRNSGRGLSEADYLNSSLPDRSSAEPWLTIGVYLDGLRSCHNVGSIVRTVEAFRLGLVYFSSDMMAPNHPQIKKTSMGSWGSVQMDQISEIDALPRPLIALETVPKATPFNEWIYPASCTIVLGNEERGIRPDILRQCDAVVTIPLAGQKNSLNVANAFAIVAAEAAFQHRGSAHV